MIELNPDYTVDKDCVIHDPKYRLEDKLELLTAYYDREIAYLSARIEALERVFG